MHIQYCKSTYDKRVASGPSICHQMHPLSAISTTGKKREKTCLNSKTSEMYIIRDVRDKRHKHTNTDR